MGARLETGFNMQFDVLQDATIGGALTFRYNAVFNISGLASSYNLPKISAQNKGEFFIFKKDSNPLNTLTINPDAANTIDGAPNLVLNAANQSAFIISDGASSWRVV